QMITACRYMLLTDLYSTSFYLVPHPRTSTLFPYTTLFRSDTEAPPSPYPGSEARCPCAPCGCCSPPPAPARERGTRARPFRPTRDRKSTRLNSSHVKISYAVFCLKKKKNYVCSALLYATVP